MPNEIKKLEDGRISAKLETGEIFEGDPLEVTQKMAEAHVSTKRWGQEWKQKAEAVPAVQPVQPQPATAQPPVDANEKQLQQYLATNTVAGLGLGTPEEVKSEWEELKQFKEQVQTNNAITQFYQMHPEFPGTKEANDA